MKICTMCGNTGKPKLHTKGHILAEIALWCLFLLPGLIYSLWREVSRSYVCRACGSDQIVPIDSPRGRRLRAEFES